MSKKHNPWTDAAIATTTGIVCLVIVIAVIKYTTLGIIAIWDLLP